MIKPVYEDNHLLVVEKPVNMPVQGDASGDMDLLTACKAYIKEKYHKPGEVYLGLVHRLDRPVGGVMVFSRVREHFFQRNKSHCFFLLSVRYLQRISMPPVRSSVAPVM